LTVALRDYVVGEIAEDAVDGRISRREALRRLGLLGLSVAAASALLAACGDDDDDAAPATTATARKVGASNLAGGMLVVDGLNMAYADGGTRAAVLVVHENRGLTPHFHDLVGRFAGEGFTALSVDLASEEGGTASMDEGAVQAALTAAPLDRLVGDLKAGIDELARRAPGAPIAVVGFCFGGGLTWLLLQDGDPRIKVAVPFYVPAPDPADFSQSHAAVLAIYPALDDRVNATKDRAVAALEAAGLEHDVLTFGGVDHAFFNDTGPRYDEASANDAWGDTLNWIRDHT
jgi:carboxymethylenebutenolidase